MRVRGALEIFMEILPFHFASIVSEQSFVQPATLTPNQMGLSWGEQVAATHRHWERNTGRLIRRATESVAKQGLDAPYDSLGLVDLAKEKHVRDMKAEARNKDGVVDRLAVQFPSHVRFPNPLTKIPNKNPGHDASMRWGYRSKSEPELTQNPYPINFNPSRRERIVYVAHVHSTALTPFNKKCASETLQPTATPAVQHSAPTFAPGLSVCSACDQVLLTFLILV